MIRDHPQHLATEGVPHPDAFAARQGSKPFGDGIGVVSRIPDAAMACLRRHRALAEAGKVDQRVMGSPFQGDPVQASDGMFMPTTERLDGANWCQGQLEQLRHQRNPGRTPSGPRRPGRRAQSDALKADEPGAARVPAPAGPAWPSPPSAMPWQLHCVTRRADGARLAAGWGARRRAQP